MIPESAIEKGDEVVGYIGAGPPKNTGLHRYVFLVYKQPNGKIEHSENRISNRYALAMVFIDSKKRINWTACEYFTGKFKVG